VFRKKVRAGRSKREVEDIFLSEMTIGVRARVTGYASCAKRSEREQGREMTKRTYRFQQKYYEIGPLNNRG
jgi:hypothetical protein